MQVTHGQDIAHDRALHYCANVGLAEEVRATRERLGLTQKEFARLAKVSLKTISNLERGKRQTMNTRTLDHLRNAMAIAAAPPAVVVPSKVPPFDPSLIGEVIDFTAGLTEVELEAEIACGPPMDLSVKGERVLVRSDGPPPDPEQGEYLVRARGDSMLEWGIEDGDYVVIQRRRGVVAYGEVVVAWYDDGLTIKQWDKVDGKKMLLGGNEHAPSYEVRDGVMFEIQGVVRRVLPRPRRRFPKISG
jgi:SOS-response transcriptional repressor LexA